MQDQNPTIFTKRGSYDGNKNLFSLIKYPFGESAKVYLDDAFSVCDCIEQIGLFTVYRKRPD